ncbi:MAG TPA: protein kinase [Vicinamibacterales bacterium]|nr:protein kinase [Vicinamibacterales bacterium]
MPLAAGTRLGSFEIISALGAGGMGEVYRARDAKLNREVAIKVLPERLAQDPAALARFEREAHAVAALSHPNILAIFDFGTSTPGDSQSRSVQGTPAITYAVTELLEGTTLRQRLSDGALPVRKAIDFAVHIVRGIAAAHERGIVHRDLKPENIFITNDGAVKILDFGLAKSAGPESQAGAAPTAMQTQMADTTPGMVLGTVGYMSPEQVRGLALDHRTDIFSFGAIFYEMLTGQRAFRGDSHVETMNAILKEDPPEFSAVTANVPGALERVIRRCLEKLPSDRFHSAHDLAISLEAFSGASTSSGVHTGSMAHLQGSAAHQALHDVPARSKTMPLVIAGVVIAASAAAFFAGRFTSQPEPPSQPDMRRLTYRRGPVMSARMSKDGTTFVYSAAWEGTPRQVYAARSDTTESLSLPYLDADVVSVSAKGDLAIIQKRRNITGYSRPGTLARATMTGGASRDVLEDVQDADWLPDGSNLAVSRVVDGKYQLEFPIGKVLYKTDGWISHVRVSPDGQKIAFLDQPIIGDDRGTLSIVDGAGKKFSMSINCESTQGMAWLPSGKEVWFSCAANGLSRAVMAGAMDGTVRTVLRVPGSLYLGDVGADGSVLVSHDNERMAVVGLPPGETRERDISWLDWTQASMLSEDGRTLLITEAGEGGGKGYSTFIRKTDGSPAVRLGKGLGLAMSADGKWVIAQNIDTSPEQLVLMPTGAGEARALTQDDITHVSARFLPDGKRFIFNGYKPGKPPRTWIQPLSGGAALPVTPEGVVTGQLVPDGTKVMARDADGQRKLFPIDPPGGAPEPIKFLEAAEGVLRIIDAHTVFVRRQGPNGTILVSRLDLATGTRTPVRTIIPPQEALTTGCTVLVSADGSSYTCNFTATNSDLFLVKGLR